MLHIGFMEKSNASDEEIFAYCKENWKLSKVRQYCTEKHISRKDIPAAIAVLKESLEADKDAAGLILYHRKNLKDMYKQLGIPKHTVNSSGYYLRNAMPESMITASLKSCILPRNGRRSERRYSTVIITRQIFTARKSCGTGFYSKRHKFLHFDGIIFCTFPRLRRGKVQKNMSFTISVGRKRAPSRLLCRESILTMSLIVVGCAAGR